MWNMKKVTVIPVVVGALGAVSTEMERLIKMIGIVRLLSESRAFAKNGIIGNTQDFENGTYAIKEANLALGTFGNVLQLALKVIT